MVQSVGSPADSFTLFQSGGARRTASGGSAGSIASFGATAQSGPSSDASTDSIASILDNDPAQTTSGDFANVFQRLSAGLQSLMVQLQSMAGGAGAPSAAAPPTAGKSGDDDAPPTAGATTDGAATLSAAEDAMRTEAIRHPSGGNRALQGDVDAMINDLRGFIQVGNGDAMAAADSRKLTSSVNDNGAADGSTTAAQQSTASDMAAANALGETTYGYAQNLMQALQNYSVASANVSNPQRSALVSTIG